MFTNIQSSKIYHKSMFDVLFANRYILDTNYEVFLFHSFLRYWGIKLYLLVIPVHISWMILVLTKDIFNAYQ